MTSPATFLRQDAPDASWRRVRLGTPCFSRCSEGPIIQVRDVARALADHDELRHRAFAYMRAFGGDLDRWRREDRWAMCDALSHVADIEELRGHGRSTAGRSALRDIRRRLEDELCAAEHTRARRFQYDGTKSTRLEGHHAR